MEDDEQKSSSLKTWIVAAAAIGGFFWITDYMEESENISNTALRETDEAAYFAWVASELDKAAPKCVAKHVTSRAREIGNNANRVARNVSVSVDDFDILNEDGAANANEELMSFTYQYKAELDISAVSAEQAFKQTENEMAAAALSRLYSDSTSGSVTVKASFENLDDGEVGTKFECE